MTTPTIPLNLRKSTTQPLSWADVDGNFETLRTFILQLFSNQALPTVLDFGAVGNGIADDTAAFDAAVASGKAVIIPNGSYYITKSYTGAPPFIILGKTTWTHPSGYRVFARFNVFGNCGSKVSDSQTPDREELQIYAKGGDAYTDGSRGAGVHFYGNADSQHAGNIYFMTGPDDAGDARLIILGGSSNPLSGGYPGVSDTVIILGNAITDYSDTLQPMGMLTLKNPIGRPAVYIIDASETEGDLAVPNADKFLAGHWDGTTFTPRIGYTSSGSFVAGSATADFGVTTDDLAGASIDYTGQLRLSRENGIVAAIKRMNGDGQMIGFYRDRVSVGNIASTTTATSYNTSSDYRLKTDVTPADQAAAVAAVLSWPMKNFEFTAAPGVAQTGVLAHELQAVKPSAVTGQKDDIGPNGEPLYQGVDYSKLVPELTVSVQYALTRIADLEARVADLESA